MADSPGTNLRRCALEIAGAAVVGVRTEVDATGVTPREPGRAVGVTPAVLLAVHSAWATAFPTTTIAAAPSLRARRHAPLAAGTLGAGRIGSAAHIAAGAAVVRIGCEIDALSAA